MKTIGDRIKERREELDMTQEELAIRLGYKSRSSVNKIELGHHNLTQKKIKQIADALLTTPSYIMGWLDEDTPSEIARRKAVENNLYQQFLDLKVTANELALIDKYRQLDDDTKSMIDIMINTRLAQLGDKTEEEKSS